MAILKNTTIAGTDAIRLPIGTTAQRPASPAAGDMRFNSTLDTVEFYDGSFWRFMPDIVRLGLICNVDAAEPDSYPGTGTNWNDLNGGTDDGTISGATYNSGNGGHFIFDGINDYVNFGDKFDLIMGSFEYIFNFDSTISGASDQRLWGKHESFESRYASSAHVIDLGESASVTSARTTWTSGTWYNVCVTWDSRYNRSTLYVNGAQDATGTAASPVGLSGDFWLGASSDNLAYIDGKIASFRVYNRELTYNEVYQNYAATKTRFGI